MTQGIPPPAERRLGRAKPGGPLWLRRYNALRKQGFVHREAAQLSEGRIDTPMMRKGRVTRRRWYEGVIAKGLTPAEIEAAVDAMYDEFDWADAYTQFYPEVEE